MSKVIKYEGITNAAKRTPVSVSFAEVKIGKRCYAIDGEHPHRAFYKTSALVASRGDEKVTLGKTTKVLVFGFKAKDRTDKFVQPLDAVKIVKKAAKPTKLKPGDVDGSRTLGTD